MIRTPISNTVLNGLDRLFQMFPDAEKWLEANFNADTVHWDDFENFHRITIEYFDQKEGEFTVLMNKHNESLMVVEIQELSYVITGEIDGPKCEIHFGTKDELETFYLTYARKNYNSDLASYQDAKLWIKENWNNDQGIVLF